MSTIWRLRAFDSIFTHHRSISIMMTGLCQAEQAPCDKLMADFRALNERVKQNIQSKLKKNQ
jgi:hypothetical protein